MDINLGKPNALIISVKSVGKQSNNINKKKSLHCSNLLILILIHETPDEDRDTFNVYNINIFNKFNTRSHNNNSLLDFRSTVY